MRTATDGVHLAECAEDGGKWVIYCTHYDCNDNEVATGLLQDSNKARLSKWLKHSNLWCPFCMETAQ